MVGVKVPRDTFKTKHAELIVELDNRCDIGFSQYYYPNSFTTRPISLKDCLEYLIVREIILTRIRLKDCRIQ